MSECTNRRCQPDAERITEIVRRYKAGQSTFQIARRFDCSRGHVRRLLNAEALRLIGTFRRVPGTTAGGTPDRRRVI